METAHTRPLLPSYTAITPATRAPDRNEPAAKTELPPANTVNPSANVETGGTAAQDNRAAHSSTPSAQVERRNVRDPESESLIFIATNSDTGEVVRQVPSETLRRLRAYAKTMSDQTTGVNPQNISRTA